MADLRALLADALREHRDSRKPTWANERICQCGTTYRTMPPPPDFQNHLVDVLLSLPGIAIIELPTESWPHNYGRSFGTDVHTFKDRVTVGDEMDISSSYARQLAAALLSAADAAEEEKNDA